MWNTLWTHQSQLPNLLVSLGLVPPDYLHTELQEIDQEKEKEGRARRPQKLNSRTAITDTDQQQSKLESTSTATFNGSALSPFIETLIMLLVPLPDILSNTPTQLHWSLPLIPPQLLTAGTLRLAMMARLMYLRGTAENEDMRQWIQHFEYKMEEAEWDATNIAKMFGKLMQEGLLAAKWYKGLDKEDKGDYEKVRKAFNQWWPARAQVAQSMKEPHLS